MPTTFTERLLYLLDLLKLVTDELWEIKSKILEKKFKLQQAEETRNWQERGILAEELRMLTEVYNELKSNEHV